MTAAAAAAMRCAVEEVLAAMPADMAGRLRFGMDDPARVDWAYYPRELAGGRAHGVALSELPTLLRRLVLRLVECGTSLHAFAKVSAIRSLEPVLNAVEHHARAELRDENRYWLAVFGEPGGGEWGWRFEGHHVSLNFTIRDGHVVASTPCFFGANPAQVTHDGYAVIRPCGEEEDAGRELISSLDADRRAVATLADVAPMDLVIADAAIVPDRAVPGDPPHPLAAFQAAHEALDPEVRAALAIDVRAPNGLSGADMDDDQRSLLRDLVDVYLTRLPGDLAGGERDRIDAAGWDAVSFGWAGPIGRGGKHYYRIHGPTFLVEYDCVQDDGNHIHAVWRDPANDFGRDILRDHRKLFH